MIHLALQSQQARHPGIILAHHVSNKSISRESPSIYHSLLSSTVTHPLMAEDQGSCRYCRPVTQVLEPPALMTHCQKFLNSIYRASIDDPEGRRRSRRRHHWAFLHRLHLAHVENGVNFEWPRKPQTRSNRKETGRGPIKQGANLSDSSRRGSSQVDSHTFGQPHRSQLVASSSQPLRSSVWHAQSQVLRKRPTLAEAEGKWTSSSWTGNKGDLKLWTLRRQDSSGNTTESIVGKLQPH